MTEITKIGWVFYDGECPFCLGWLARVRPYLVRHGLMPLPLQGEEAQRRLGGGGGEDELKVVFQTGMIYGGADALMVLAEQGRWGWVARAVRRVPGAMPVLRWGYRQVARRRRCMSGACAVGRGAGRLRWWDALPLVVLPAGLWVLAVGMWMPGWVSMWALAVGLFAGCKWVTLRAQPAGCPFRAAAYLLLWPGMDAGRFLNEAVVAPAPGGREWAGALGKTLLGALIVWGGVRLVPAVPLLQGWVGMVGLIFMLHFGAFHLVSLAWRLLGVDAQPLMHCPPAAKTLGDFWGARWNRGFHDLVDRWIYRPLVRRRGVLAGLFGAFFVSGGIHEIAITLPARGGFGLPTLYFLLQALGIAVQRSMVGRRLGFARGAGARVWTWLVVIGPVGWLFPPVFVKEIMVPFFEILKAL